MIDVRIIFEAIPHAEAIWVTDDGHFHLHEHNGGKKFERAVFEQEKYLIEQENAQRIEVEQPQKVEVDKKKTKTK